MGPAGAVGSGTDNVKPTGQRIIFQGLDVQMAQLRIMSDTQWRGLWAERAGSWKKSRKYAKLEKNHTVQDHSIAMHPHSAPGHS